MIRVIGFYNFIKFPNKPSSSEIIKCTARGCVLLCSKTTLMVTVLLLWRLHLKYQFSSWLVIELLCSCMSLSLCMGWGCLLLVTRTTLLFTVIIVVCSFERMCTPSVVFISCCVSELLCSCYTHIVMHGLRLFIVVLQKTTLFTVYLTYFDHQS